MALVLADRVRETTTTTGTGTISLGGPVSGFQGFSAAIGNANTTYYTIADAATGAWEVGLGTYTSSGSTLARTTILSSSNAGAAVNFAAGTKDVFVTQPAERALYLVGAGTGINAGAAAFTANGVVYASSTSALATGSALTFDGTTLTAATQMAAGTTGTAGKYLLNRASDGAAAVSLGLSANDFLANNGAGGGYIFNISNTEQARLTSSGLEIKQSQLIGYNSYTGIGTNGLAVAGNVGVGTASPDTKLTVTVADNAFAARFKSTNGIFRVLPFETGLGVKLTALNGNESAFEALVYQAANHQFVTGVTERMRLDSAGNLGLGNTPSGWSLGRALQVGTSGDAALLGFANSSYLTANAYFAGGWLYRTSATAGMYQISGNIHSWHISTGTNTIDTSTAFSQAMTLDASGNLVVGTTSALARLHVTTGEALVALIATSRASGGFARYDLGASGGTIGYTGSAGQLITSGGVNDLAIRADNNLVFSAGGATERSRISSDGTFRVKGAGTAGSTDAFQVAGTAPASSLILSSAGNLGIGAASPSSKLDVSVASSGTFQNAISSSNSVDSDFVVRIKTGISDINNSAGVLTFSTSSTERARIDSSGNLLVGNATAVVSSKFLSQFDGSTHNGAILNETANTTSSTFLGFSLSGTLIGSVGRVGATSAVIYNTTSDYRLKTVIGPVANAGQRIDALQPVEYTWNSNGSRTRGFLAHQFQEVYAGSVSGTKDAVDAEGKPVYQAMQASTSEVIADLVAEIQDLRKRLAAAGI
jgi:hypothetical protein